jgi:hypothetical protein
MYSFNIAVDLLGMLQTRDNTGMQYYEYDTYITYICIELGWEYIKLSMKMR